MTHVAVVLPGRAYGPELPVLRYPARALAQRGAVVRAVAYPDVSGPGGFGDEGFAAAVADAVTETTADATQVTLIGKSLGTAAMALLPDGVPGVATRAIWLTPIFGYDGIGGRAAAKAWPSLYVYGTADPAHDAAAQQAVAQATGGREVAIEGGDHALEVADDVRASIEAMSRLVDSVLEFVRP